MAVAVGEGVVHFKLIDVVRQRARFGGRENIRLIGSHRDVYHFGHFLIKGRRVVTNETTAVGVFARRVYLYARQVGFKQSAYHCKGLFVVFHIAVYQHEEFKPGARRADMAGFHICQCFGPGKQFRR